MEQILLICPILEILYILYNQLQSHVEVLPGEPKSVVIGTKCLTSEWALFYIDYLLQFLYKLFKFRFQIRHFSWMWSLLGPILKI